MSKGHLNRKELIAALKNYKGELTGHLAQCRECREDFEFLRRFRVAGQPSLPDAPTGWMNRATALSEKKGSLKKAIRTLAELVFDSWTMPEPVGVRGHGAIKHRRLRFESSGLTLDVRAEQTHGRWSFVAHTTGEYPLAPVLMADDIEYYADENGIYQWTDRRAPRKITLRLQDSIIDVPELIWKKPKKR